MLNCREVSRLVSQSLDRDLPWWTRARMRLHLLLCKMCARYERQVKFLHHAVREWANEETAPGETAPALSPESRERIRSRLNQA